MPDAMSRMDTEMMDGDNAASTVTVRQNQQNDSVRELLTLARQMIRQGKPSQALQAVIVAMRTSGGDEVVFQSLHRARELYLKRMQESTAVDQLASLFAECVIAEAQPFGADTTVGLDSSSVDIPGAHENSILAETGRTQVVLDAFADGSSFICLQCGGLVSNHRKDEHYTFWCSNLSYG